MRTFNGHIKKDTAIKYDFDLIVLSVFDWSGKGRGSEKHIYRSNAIQFNQLKGWLIMEYIVKKIVEIVYTIEADTEKHAINLARAMELDEADQVSVYEIEAESIADYEESMKWQNIRLLIS